VSLSGLLSSRRTCPNRVGTPGFYLTDLGDWDALPESKSDLRERPQADGAYNIGTDYRQSLPFSISGLYVGATRSDVQSAKALAKQAVGQGHPVPVIVDDADGPMRRVASVRRITPDSGYGGNVWGFTIDLVAFDPLMYGDDQYLTTGAPMSGGGLIFPLGTTPTKYWDFGADGLSGRVSFTNTGTAPTWPTLQATGGLSGGFTAADVTTGQIVRFDRVIPVGSTVQVNQRTGRAWIDAPGNDVSGQLTGRDFFCVGPGETHQIQFAPIGTATGSPSFTAIIAPAYV
jgi:hypothetical protein